jgi:microcystin-dependent protein
MTRSANLAIADHAATACTMSGSITNCAALTSGATGGDGAHNNMMPFIALNYIIYAGA